MRTYHIALPSTSNGGYPPEFIVITATVPYAHFSTGALVRKVSVDRESGEVIYANLDARGGWSKTSIEYFRRNYTEVFQPQNTADETRSKSKRASNGFDYLTYSSTK